MTKYFLAAIVLLCLAFGASVKSCQNARRECVRLAGNQQALLEEATYYRTQEGHSAAQVERLLLTNEELEKHRTDLTKTVKELNLKIKNLQSASTTTTETRYVIQTELRDSIVYHDHFLDTLQCIRFDNPYLVFDGCISQGKFSGYIESRDTLIQIIHRIPRKFLCFRWGTKAIMQQVISRNPYSDITYTEYLEFYKGQ